MKKVIIIAISLCVFHIDILAQPIINSISPSNVIPFGSIVTIQGSNFDPTPSSNIVFIGAVRATVTSATANSLTLTVPSGGTYGPISVTTNSLTAYSPSAFCPSYSGIGVIDASSFDAKVDFTTTNYPRYIVTSDLDEDGKPDLTVVNNVGNSLSIFKNNSVSGLLQLAPKVDFNTGLSPMQATAGDIDGDGKPDLIVGNYASADNSIFIFRNISVGGMISLATPISFPTGRNPRFIAISDINLDGKPDMIVVNNNDYNVSVFENNSVAGTISFAPRVNFPLGTWPMPVAVLDIDGDNKPDIVAGDYNDNVISVLRNLSTSSLVSFAPRLTFSTGTNPNSIAIGDLDLDGKPEIISGNVGSSSISIFKNISSIGSVSFSPKLDLATGVGPYDVTIGDVDGDQRPDIATANFNASTVSLLKNLSTPGSILFQAKVDFTTGTLPRSVSICDYDGDGKPDLAVSNSVANTMSILKNKISLTPLKLLSFQARIVSKSSLLSWETDTEQNVSHFLVQHSNDGINFFNIGRVESLGNTSGVTHYHFDHDSPMLGLNFYRLKVVDKDDSYKYSQIAKTKFDRDSKIYFSSNPANGSVYLYHPISTSGVIRISDVLGRTMVRIAASKNANSTMIDLAKFKSGNYIVSWNYKSNILNCILTVK